MAKTKICPFFFFFFPEIPDLSVLLISHRGGSTH